MHRMLVCNFLDLTEICGSSLTERQLSLYSSQRKRNEFFKCILVTFDVGLAHFNIR